MIKLSKLIEESGGIYSDPFTTEDIDMLLEHIDDIMDSLDDKNIQIDDESSKIFNFEISGLKYEVRFDIQLTKNNKKLAEIKFYLLNNPKKPDRKNFSNDTQYNIAVKKSQVGITNTGYSLSVFSHVVSIIISYCKKHNIDYITFTAEENGRKKLYVSIIKKVLSKYQIPYKQIFTNPLDGSAVNSEEFWLEKI
jgi:hypothetical protein